MEIRILIILLEKRKKKTNFYNKLIEWIPFDRLENIQEIGFSTVYSANWIDDRRVYDVDLNKGTPSREKTSRLHSKT